MEWPGIYLSLTEGAVLVVTIISWDLALNWLGYKVPALNRLISRPPKELVRNGRMNRRVMDEELITKACGAAGFRAENQRGVTASGQKARAAVGFPTAALAG